MLAQTTTKTIPFLKLFQTMGTRTRRGSSDNNDEKEIAEHRRHGRRSRDNQRKRNCSKERIPLPIDGKLLAHQKENEDREAEEMELGF
ncbi:hypothetical protein KFK09_027534 [Dendrobium nobile]|uniref:Uncharacterized protein n=1 Tax=Dendrobium nobile TaxID=94219 RepID=A0A8T3AAU7_DENNO|nr:hypothetical protein KFK09_027534 [Dendrobium nobile]